MNFRTSMIAAAALCTAAFSPLAASGEKNQATGLRAAPLPAPLLLAQAGAQKQPCVLDGKKLPSGSRLCANTKEMVCSPKGVWEKTGRNC